MKTKDSIGDVSGILPNTDKKRKRTSIAAPEKRLLEDYFRFEFSPSLYDEVRDNSFSTGSSLGLLEKESLRSQTNWI